MAVPQEQGARAKMPERVLIVDDDKNILDSYRRRLGRALEVEVCDDPVEALQMLGDGQEYAVIISDFLMPKLNGVQFLAKCKQKSPQSVRMMLTGISDFGTSVDAVNSGNVFRFLIKPCPPETLGQALVDGIRQYRLEQAEGNMVRDTLREAIRLAVDIAAIADPGSFADAGRLSAAVAAVAATIDEDHSTEIEIAWLLSGLGQLTVPDEVLAKQRSGGGLAAQEAALIEKSRHASVKLTERLPQLEMIAAMIEGDKAPSKGRRIATTASSSGSAILAAFHAVAELKARGVEDSEIAPRLRAEHGKLDSNVVKAIEHYFETRGDAGFPSAISLEELRAGDVLAADVRTADGRVLAGAGMEVSFLLAERIRNFGSVQRVQEPISVLRPGVTVELA